MKFTPEVLAALATLREHADNDFERHRINVLERDLTAPPTVEVIDDKHQRFNGVVYRKDSCGHYENDLRIHRAVYLYCAGEIPAGCEIHHRDTNKANNDISNLQCLTQVEHRRKHSPKGKRVALPDKKTCTCEHCGKEYTTDELGGKNRFCSPKCKEQHLYRENMITFKCQFCGKEFIANRHNKPKFCSHHCAQANRFLGRREKRNCLVCGKEFETIASADQKCCSNHCAAVLRERKKKANQPAS